MGVALHDEPEVIELTAACDGIVDEDHAVGKLKRFWSWADQHLVDGNAPGVTEKWIDRYVGVTGFASALESVGWLTVNSDGIAIPGFEVHMSQSAKRRAVTAKRVAKSRGKNGPKCNAPGVTKSVPRVEKEKSKSKGKPPKPPLDFSKIEFPDGFDTPAVREAWAAWLKDKPSPYKNLETANRSLRTYCGQFENAGRLVLGINLALAGGWQGLSLDAAIRAERAKANGSHARPDPGDPRGNFAAADEWLRTKEQQ